MRIWLSQHQDAARLALRRLAAAPVNSLLSLLAIGIALALPAGGQMLLANALQLSGTTSAVPQISVFMATNAERQAATEIGERLGRHAGVKQVLFVPREETLARMKSGPGLREVIEALPANPFPDAFVLLAALLGTGLIAISFSIIRMQVLTQRSEIEVSRLLGATNGYIQRPFLYFGVFLGLGGGVLAWLLVAAAALWLRAPLAELARLYDLTLALQTLGTRDSALLLGFAASLGWLGAMISMRQHMRQY